MIVSNLVRDLRDRHSILINQHDKVTQHLSENEDTILVIHHSLTSSNNTDTKANLAGLLIRLHARRSALIHERFAIEHHIKEIDDSLEVILQLPPSHGL
jgi:hypothetical protein